MKAISPGSLRRNARRTFKDSIEHPGREACAAARGLHPYVVIFFERHILVGEALLRRALMASIPLGPAEGEPPISFARNNFFRFFVVLASRFTSVSCGDKDFVKTCPRG